MPIPNFATTGSGILENTIGQLLDTLQSQSGVFSDVGLTFLSLAVTLALLSGVYNWWTSGSIQDLVANGVRMLIVVGPLLILFNGWSGYMTTFEKFFYNELPSHLGITGGSPAAVVGQSMQKIMSSMDLDPKSVEDADGNWMTKLSSFMSMKTVYNAILNFIVLILNALLIFGILFAVFMPIAGLYIGAIFGPLILAWLPWKPLSDMTARWTGFMIANGITFVVALVILKALATTIANMSAILAGMAADGVLSGLAGYIVTLVALFAIYIFATNLLLQANNMAEGMTGGATVGEGLFGKLSAGLGGMGMLRAGGAAANLHKMGGAAAGKAAGQAPGVIASGTDKLGKGAQALGAARAIDNKTFGGALTSIGNATRAVSAPLNAAQKGIDKTRSVLDKAADRIKGNKAYQELDKPFKPKG